MKILSKEHKENIKNGLLKSWDKRGRTGTVMGLGYKLNGVNLRRVYEHRLVVENNLGRKLSPKETIHHINGDKLDNRLENLEIMSRSEHSRLHAIRNGLGKDRIGKSPTNKTSIEIIMKIIDLRKGGLSIEKISKEIGVSYPTVWFYCKINKLNKKNVRRIKKRTSK